ncbi:MAG: class I SAM-dependent methyltransferase [Chlamydiales bacterium]|nr:class I SAM-dependent methyltransferase [Chlamydiales bacterium]
MKTKIVVLLLAGVSLFGVDAKWERFKRDVVSKQKLVHGWCNPEKAKKMMELIYEVKPDVCVEVGVFGGASIHPTAQALKFNNKGYVVAIDPWDNVDCLEGYDPDDPNFKWWSEVDMKAIFAHFKAMLKRNRLEKFCRIMKTTSAKAVEEFEDGSIDILHIDGNHTEDSAYFDAISWFPKVKQGGYIWFDDVNWTSTGKAIRFMKENCKLIKSRSVGNECYLFKKGS